jgi:thiopurine S-methyltransferase
VLVPLCGRTLDLGWLRARGARVVGAELSPIAARGVFEDLGRDPVITAGPVERWDADGVTLFVGDVFDVTPDALAAAWADAAGPVHVWDRAALIALPPAVRPRYAAHLRALAGPGASLLLDTVAYDQARMEGPPFSVPDDEVAALYAGHDVEVWESADEPVSERFRERGLSTMRRSVTHVRVR